MPLTFTRRQYFQAHLAIRLALILVVSWILLPAPAFAQSPNQAPVVGTNAVLYDGALGGTPDTQQFSYLPVGPAGNTASGGITTLDTTAGDNISAGYFRNFPSDSGWPVLNRATGYAVKFNAQLVSESHVNSNRAGFSVIALSSDKKGIELGFWANEIWAQHDDTTGSLFTHAESVAFDTTAALIPYELTVLSDTYSLSISHTQVLTGPLRDYTAFAGFPDVYESPNFIFLGDDTTSAQARVRIGYVSVITNAALPDRSANGGQPLVINDIGLLDVDAYGSSEVVTLTVSHGTLTLSDSVPGGLSAAKISGNGSGQLVLFGPVGQINSSLVYSPALTYTGHTFFDGVDTLTAQVSDQGHTGAGGALSDSKSLDITVQSPGTLSLDLTPSYATNQIGTPHTVTATVRANGAPVGAGYPITFTISSGPHVGQSSATATDTNGQVTLTYTGTATGIDAISATGVISGGSATGGPVQKEWINLQLTMVPQQASNPVSSTHTVTATLLENGGPPQSLFAYVFSVTGTHQLTPAAVSSNSQGQGVFSYTGTLTGTDSISVRVDYHSVTVITTVQKVWFDAGVSAMPVYLPIVLKSVVTMALSP